MYQLPAPTNMVATATQPTKPTTRPTTAKDGNATLGGLTAMPTALGTALTAWAGAQHIATQPAAYLGALALAYQANGNQPVTLAQVTGMHYAAGGIAPGRNNPNGWANKKALPVWRSHYYGAQRHVASGALARYLQTSTLPNNGGTVYRPTGTLAALLHQHTTDAATLRKLATRASAKQDGQTAKRGGTPTYGVQTLPATPVARPTRKALAKPKTQ